MAAVTPAQLDRALHTLKEACPGRGPPGSYFPFPSLWLRVGVRGERRKGFPLWMGGLEVSDFAYLNK